MITAPLAATVLAQMLEPTTGQLLVSYVLWVPLAVVSFRHLRHRSNPVRVGVPVVILVSPPIGLLLWLLFVQVWTTDRPSR